MKKANAAIAGIEGVSGFVHFNQEGDGRNELSPTIVFGKISGLKPGLHAFNIHELGNIANGCMSTGVHFNPFNKQHGAPEDENRHAGDLGNVRAGDDGTASFRIVDKQIPLSGPTSIVGKAVVIHAGADDLGKGSNQFSKVHGNAGLRIACGPITQQGKKKYVCCLRKKQQQLYEASGPKGPSEVVAKLGPEETLGRCMSLAKTTPFPL
ncbi:superoxide dismutase [Cu-Zn]-like [Rutidosis leptorrhynchoides]|uniref:superoxide dismutase [Cu-Zn]-like n=1 Tax=Rutidosis leptorrhynchoides TaxID=125765 RepID=UPI003A99A152